MTTQKLRTTGSEFEDANDLNYRERDKDDVNQVELVVESMLTSISSQELQAKDVRKNRKEELGFPKWVFDPWRDRCKPKTWGYKSKSDHEPRKKYKPKPSIPVNCNICKKILSKRPNLVRHYLRYHKEFPIPAPDPRRPHVRTGAPKTPVLFKCDHCQKVFRLKGSYKAHLRIHRPEGMKLFECKTCHKEFIHHGSYSRHVKIHFRKFLNCEKCDFKTQILKDFKYHKKYCQGLEMDVESQISCVKCRRHFKDEAEFLLHQNQKKENCEVTIFVCKEKGCGKLFYKKFFCKEHEETVHGDDHENLASFPCTFCDLKFKSNEWLDRHIGRVHCWKCDRVGCTAETFRSPYKLALHKADCKFPIQCKLCEQTFENKDEFSTHAHSMQCEKCEKTFDKKSLMDLHQKYHDLQEILYKCEECTFGFTSQGENTAHLKMVHLKDNKILDNFTIEAKATSTAMHNFTCKLCNFVFTDPSKEEIVDHAISNHKDIIGPFICPVCTKGIKKEANFFMHQKKAHGLVNMNFQCEICDSSFSTQHGLAVHKAVTHYETPLLDSNVVSVSTVHPIPSQTQINIEHDHDYFKQSRSPAKSSLSKYHCSICGKKCVGQLAVHKHMSRHKMNQHYKCKICTMSWASSTSFEQHNRHRHPNLILEHPIAPLVCPHCGKSFKYADQLKIHLRNRGRKYKCKVCAVCFRSQEQLESHGHLIHGHKRKPCDFCLKTFITRKACKLHERRVHKHGVL